MIDEVREGCYLHELESFSKIQLSAPLSAQGAPLFIFQLVFESKPTTTYDRLCWLLWCINTFLKRVTVLYKFSKSVHFVSDRVKLAASLFRSRKWKHFERKLRRFLIGQGLGLSWSSDCPFKFALMNSLLLYFIFLCCISIFPFFFHY